MSPLTEEQLRRRAWHTTASSAPIIMGGDPEALIRLWRERIGEIEPADLSGDWPVQLGSFLESYILDWHQQKTGKLLTERGAFMQHRGLDYVGATLDAYREQDDCVLDVKVCSAWRPLDEIIAYYTPQIIVQMRCRECAHGALLIMHGTAEPREYEIIPDADYERELWQRIAAFEMCVRSLSPPAPLPKVTPPEQWRAVNLDTLPECEWPNWGHALAAQLIFWTQTKAAADRHEATIGEIKKLLPDDVGKLEHLNVDISRNRKGSVSIKAKREAA